MYVYLRHNAFGGIERVRPHQAQQGEDVAAGISYYGERYLAILQLLRKGRAGGKQRIFMHGCCSSVLLQQTLAPHKAGMEHVGFSSVDQGRYLHQERSAVRCSTSGDGAKGYQIFPCLSIATIENALVLRPHKGPRARGEPAS